MIIETTVSDLERRRSKMTSYQRTLYVVVLLTMMICCHSRFVDPRSEAKEILDAAGVRNGLIVHLGCGDGKLTAALKANETCLVHGLGKDVETARSTIRELGVYGRVSVERLEKRLPYADNVVNLIIAEDPDIVPTSEVMRALAPGGVFCSRRDGKWQRVVKPRPEEIDEWTHFFHSSSNNAVAKDSVAGPPKRLQWTSGPAFARSHEIISSLTGMVSADNRLFYIYDEGPIGVLGTRYSKKWSLIARNAFNGLLLWKRPVTDWVEGHGRTHAPVDIARCLVAKGDRVFVTLSYAGPLSILDAVTGKTLATCTDTEGTRQILCTGKHVIAYTSSDQVIVLNAKTGKELWRYKLPGKLADMMLAANTDRIVCRTTNELICLKMESGKVDWKAQLPPAPSRWIGRLVLYEDLVLLRHRIQSETEAYSISTGKKLWSKQLKGKLELLYVINGLIRHPESYLHPVPSPEMFWDNRTGKTRAPETGVKVTGIDPWTGEVKETVTHDNLFTPGYHFRCYPNKATERYLIMAKRGIEFVDLKGAAHSRNDWVRGICRYGVMPCNGLIYVPPNQCLCYAGADLSGFNVMAPAPADGKIPEDDALADRFEKGPAFEKVTEENVSPDDWPAYRHDSQRSGGTPCTIPTQLKTAWSVRIGGKLTQPVIVNGRLYVVSKDTHSIHSLAEKDGKELWRFTAGGRIDSSPTIHKGMVLFGSTDGWLYALRAADGELCWRFRAAPRERRIVSYGQLESAWPVHGSPLIKKDVVYVTAGRSSFLDGGIRLYGLNVKTGAVLYKNRLDGPWVDINKDIGNPFYTKGSFSDLLVTDKDKQDIYMLHERFDSCLNKRAAQYGTRLGDKKVGRHIFSTTGFLDDSYWDRSFWMHAETWPGINFANQAPKAGQLIVFDKSGTYSVKCFPGRRVHSPGFLADKGYLLFADDNDNEPTLYDGKPDSPKPLKWIPNIAQEAPGYERAGAARYDFNTIDYNMSTGFTRTKPPLWQQWQEIRIRAMVKAKNALVIAGPPDAADLKDAQATLDGRGTAQLRVISPQDGSVLQKLDLDEQPVFDGMSAAGGSVYVSTTDGKIICYKGE